MFNRFLLGRLSVDEAVRRELHRTPLDMVARHAVGDFGVVSVRRNKQNLIALDTGDEIISEYLADPTQPDGPRVRVVTADGWGSTHITLTKPQPRKKHDPSF